MKASKSLAKKITVWMIALAMVMVMMPTWALAATTNPIPAGTFTIGGVPAAPRYLGQKITGLKLVHSSGDVASGAFTIDTDEYTIGAVPTIDTSDVLNISDSAIAKSGRIKSANIPYGFDSDGTTPLSVAVADVVIDAVNPLTAVSTSMSMGPYNRSGTITYTFTATNAYATNPLNVTMSGVGANFVTPAADGKFTATGTLTQTVDTTQPYTVTYKIPANAAASHTIPAFSVTFAAANVNGVTIPAKTVNVAAQTITVADGGTSSANLGISQYSTSATTISSDLVRLTLRLYVTNNTGSAVTVTPSTFNAYLESSTNNSSWSTAVNTSGISYTDANGYTFTSATVNHGSTLYVDAVTTVSMSTYRGYYLRWVSNITGGTTSTYAISGSGTNTDPGSSSTSSGTFSSDKFTIEMSSSPATGANVKAGDEIAYTIRGYNSDPYDWDSFGLYMYIPANTTYVDGSLRTYRNNDYFSFNTQATSGEYKSGDKLIQWVGTLPPSRNGVRGYIELTFKVRVIDAPTANISATGYLRRTNMTDKTSTLTHILGTAATPTPMPVVTTVPVVTPIPTATVVTPIPVTVNTDNSSTGRLPKTGEPASIAAALGGLLMVAGVVLGRKKKA